MNIDIRTRGKGKTHDLILEAAAKDLPIICATIAAEENIRRQAENMKLTVRTLVITSMNRTLGASFNGCLIDDAEFCLRIITGATIVTMTVGIDESDQVNVFKGESFPV